MRLARSRQYVSKFFSHALGVGFGAPLKALEQFASFDGNTLGEVLWSVELRPIALDNKCHECIMDGIVNHGVQ
jgi:hypothetical protein